MTSSEFHPCADCLTARDDSETCLACPVTAALREGTNRRKEVLPPNKALGIPLDYLFTVDPETGDDGIGEPTKLDDLVEWFESRGVDIGKYELTGPNSSSDVRSTIQFNGTNTWTSDALAAEFRVRATQYVWKMALLGVQQFRVLGYSGTASTAYTYHSFLVLGTPGLKLPHCAADRTPPNDGSVHFELAHEWTAERSSNKPPQEDCAIHEPPDSLRIDLARIADALEYRNRPLRAMADYATRATRVVQKGAAEAWSFAKELLQGD